MWLVRCRTYQLIRTPLWLLPTRTLTAPNAVLAQRETDMKQ
jgi:hypothetical protein